jgi:hypothetical protein
VTVSVRVLFGEPQHEIASLLRSRLSSCVSVSMVAGFMTVEGIEAIAVPLRLAPGKLDCLVVGAATWRAFEALDRLVAAGVLPSALFVHLGRSRATTSSGARHAFLRYHPMLHSKVYLMEMGDGTAAAFVGSHNLTGFALYGLNGEAGVLLEGAADASEFDVLRRHVAASAAQAVLYDPTMKDAYAWWTTQFIDGLRMKTNDIPDPDDAENKRTIVVIAALSDGQSPRKRDVIYFEIPAALGQWIQSLRAEVHVYLFPTVPASPQLALTQLASASTTLWCKTEGLEMERGGVELLADWQIENRRTPELKAAPKPFRPRPSAGQQQVRVRVSGPLRGKYEYLFDRGRIEWTPVFDMQEPTLVPEEARSMLEGLNLAQWEGGPWQRVSGFVPAGAEEPGGYQIALKETAPESDSFILFSLRRRDLSAAQGKTKRRH